MCERLWSNEFEKGLLTRRYFGIEISSLLKFDLKVMWFDRHWKKDRSINLSSHFKICLCFLLFSFFFFWLIYLPTTEASSPNMNLRKQPSANALGHFNQIGARILSGWNWMIFHQLLFYFEMHSDNHSISFRALVTFTFWSICVCWFALFTLSFLDFI